MAEVETGTFFSHLARLRRSAAIVVIASVLATTAPAFAQLPMPKPPPGAAQVQPVAWRWNGYRWVWVPGPRYYPPPPYRRHWIPGHWVWGPYGRHWVPGHWR